MKLNLIAAIEGKIFSEQWLSNYLNKHYVDTIYMMVTYTTTFVCFILWQIIKLASSHQRLMLQHKLIFYSATLGLAEENW